MLKINVNQKVNSLRLFYFWYYGHGVKNNNFYILVSFLCFLVLINMFILPSTLVCDV